MTVTATNNTTATPPVTGAGTSASSTGSSGAADPFASLSQNFSTFLQLLTTQLKHQDPSSPMNSDQFTQELVQFAGVEQQINTNNNLQTMISSMSSQSMANAVGYLGKSVTASGSQAVLQNGSASWVYNLDTNANAVNLTVQDASGNTVYSQTGTANAGNNSFTWNGKMFGGGTAPDGTYTLSVNATAADGSTITSNVYQQGVVSSIDTSSGQSKLIVNGQAIPLGSIMSVGQ